MPRRIVGRPRRGAFLAIQERALALDRYGIRLHVVLYAAKDNEVMTERILAHALASGRAVYYPKLDPSGIGSFCFASATRRSELQPGAYGIREPIGTDALNPSALDDALVCVPGLGFTQAANAWGGEAVTTIV